MKKLMNRRDPMNTHGTLLLLSTAVLIGLAFCQIAPAVISTTGNVDPADPATWTSDMSTWAYVGKTADGSMTINGGSDVIGRGGRIGYDPGVTGTATVTGAGSTWNDSGSLRIGYRGTGILNIENGGVVNTAGWTYIGYKPDGSGSITFNNGTLNTGGLLAAPTELRGTGVINTAGLVSDIDLVFDQNNPLQQQIILNSEPSQNITINMDQDFVGDPTCILGAGYRGQGSLTVADGKAVRSFAGELGYHAGSTGTATVTGAGSTWSSSSRLIIGDSGTGILNIENGGQVSNAWTYIGLSPGATGTATVTGTGSTWTIGDLIVGYYGTGTLNIQNGGALTVGGDLTVHRSIGGIGSGTLNIQNGGVVSVAGVLYVGGQHGGGWPPPSDPGTGTLNIQNGGSLSSKHGIIDKRNSTVTVAGIGSTWTNSGELIVDGTLNIENGAAVSNTRAYVGFTRYGSATGTVTVTGAGSIWANSSDLNVGYGDNGTGTLNIQNGGAVTVGRELSIYSVGTLDILLASLGDPLLDVGGNAGLDGTLNVALAGGFALNPGDLFTLIDLTDIASTLTGTFIGLAEGDSVGNFGGLDLFISYIGGDGNDVTLFTAQPGDFDLDGDIDGVDFGLWQTGYPTASGALLSDGDADGDGDVDGTDFGIWQANYLTNLGGSAAIPEPTTMGLLIVGALAILRRRSR